MSTNSPNSGFLDPYAYHESVKNGTEPARKNCVTKEASPSIGESRNHLAITLNNEKVKNAIQYPPEFQKIHTAQQAALEKGYLKEAITLEPHTQPTGHVAHIMPKLHRPSALFTKDVTAAKTMDQILTFQKAQFRFWSLLKEYGIVLPMFIELVTDQARESIPQPPISLNIEDVPQPIDARSEQAQSMLLMHDKVLTQVLASKIPIQPHNIISDIDFKQPLRSNTFDLSSRLSQEFTEQEFATLAILAKAQPNQQITLSQKELERYIHISQEFENVLIAMNNDFIDALLAKEGSEHVQQLVCGTSHVKHVVEGLRQKGSTVMVSVGHYCTTWRDIPLPTEQNAYRALANR